MREYIEGYGCKKGEERYGCKKGEERMGARNLDARNYRIEIMIQKSDTCHSLS